MVQTCTVWKTHIPAHLLQDEAIPEGTAFLEAPTNGSIFGYWSIHQNEHHKGSSQVISVLTDT
jgi:hypothetical protein